MTSGEEETNRDPIEDSDNGREGVDGKGLVLAPDINVQLIVLHTPLHFTRP